MSTYVFRHLYGPVPSRRLGRSLGIDLTPFKICTYDCVYCQLGRTTSKTLTRRPYVPIEPVIEELKRKLKDGPLPDFISLAGSGEPTLHSALGELINKIKTMTKIPVAVLTNGSLFWMQDVQESLMAAGLVLPSLDAGDDMMFQRVNRPHPRIFFDQMVDGIAAFTRRFTGEVWLEVMLVAGLNGTAAAAKKIAGLAERIQPARTQLNTVYRPAAEPFAVAISAAQMTAMKSCFTGQVEIIAENRPDPAQGSTVFSASDQEVLSLIGRRPCTVADIADGLGIHLNEAVKQLDALVSAQKARTIVKDAHTFYVACI